MANSEAGPSVESRNLRLIWPPVGQSRKSPTPREQARPAGDVLRLMLGQAGLLLVVGLGIGCALALAIGRTAGTLLFGLQPNDPLSFAISVLGLGIVALAAACLPAARATQMSPLDGLRAD
jgi:predicted lysophospholipase L1 biosynthesis ABC-type transport system permease subunit